jgi:hypothetical protein
MKLTVFSACVFLLVLPALAFGHHAFDAEFSRDLPIELKGTVTGVQWSNPHARVYVDVVAEDGTTNNWNLELASPNMYMRQGWGKDTLQPGETVMVTGWRARNEPYVGNVGTIKKEDGQELFSRAGRNN